MDARATQSLTRDPKKDRSPSASILIDPFYSSYSGKEAESLNGGAKRKGLFIKMKRKKAVFIAHILCRVILLSALLVLSPSSSQILCCCNKYSSYLTDEEAKGQ